MAKMRDKMPMDMPHKRMPMPMPKAPPGKK
jgi:hypothetical protein